MFKSNGTLRQIAFWGVLLTVGSLTAFGQVQTGGMQGTVADSTGAAVSGAAVTITDVDTASVRQITTDNQGRYAVADLMIGNYRVQVAMQGFASQTQEGLVLTIGQNLAVDFKLQVGTVSQQVTVAAAAASPVNTTTSEVGTLVGESQLQQLPLNGRDYMQLIELAPGVQPVQVQGATSPNFGSAQRYSVNGARVDSGSVLLDGLEIRDFWGEGAGLTITGTSLGVESIAEFETMTGTFNGQYNGASVLNEVTRSGTNSLHGSAYGFFRNSAMDARNFFDPTTGPPAFHRDQFGGALGGPIKKDKAFFFVNYEAIRAALALNNVVDVPDANAQAGLLPCKALAGVAACTGASPSTLINIGVNPLVAPYLALYPNYGVAGGPAIPAGSGYTDEGNGTAQFNSSGEQPQIENYLATKLDYQLNTKNNLSFRWVVDRGTQSDPWIAAASIGAPGIIPIANAEQDLEANWYATLQDRHIFSANLINVATFGFVRTNQHTHINEASIPSLLAGFLPGVSNSLGSINVGNVATLGFGANLFYPLQQLQNTFTEQDEVDWVHGAHSFKFGGGVSRLQCNCVQFSNAGGDFTFASLQTFLENQPSELSGAISVEPGLPSSSAAATRYSRQTFLSVFVQDDWRMTRRLTLNLGIRDDYVTDPTEAANNFYALTNLDPLTCSNDPACGTPEAGISTGFTHVPHLFENNPSTRNIDPRVGFAWDVFGDGKTSLRGAFGIFHVLIYPRSFQAGSGFIYPSAQVLLLSFNAQTGTFPNVNVSTSAPQARNQTPYNECCTPYEQEWSMTLERQLPRGLKVSLGYVGSEGTHLLTGQDANTNIPVAGTQFRPFSPAKGATLGCAPGCTQGYDVSGAGFTPNVAFSSVDFLDPEESSNYNSGILTVQRSLGKGIQFLSGFTYSRCIDYGSTAIAGIDEGNDSEAWLYPQLPKSYNRGLCAFNISKNWTSNALIPLPFHGNQLKEGWQLAFISSVRTGSPFTSGIPTTIDQSNLGEFIYVEERPNISPTFTGNLLVKKRTEWFNPAAYQLGTLGEFGNAPRENMVGPNLVSEDASVMKRTTLRKFGESTGLEIRGDLFNFPNHTNLNVPGSSIFTGTTGNALPNPQAGLITSTTTKSRQVQFSARLVF